MEHNEAFSWIAIKNIPSLGHYAGSLTWISFSLGRDRKKEKKAIDSGKKS